MKKKVLVIISILFGISLTGCSCFPKDSGNTSGNLSFMDQKLSDAGDYLGMEVPFPGYLPKDYQLTDVYHQNSSILLEYSYRGENQEYPGEVSLQVSWFDEIAPDVRLDVQQVAVNEGTGYLQERSDGSYALWWNMETEYPKRGKFELVLSASQDFPVSELVKIAESVRYTSR